MNRTQKRSTILFIISFILLCLSFGLGSYAYFKTDYAANGYANVKIELLFDKLTPEALQTYQDKLNAGAKYPLTTGDKKWGGKGNPYVISTPRHLQNLSVLQNIGYFDRRFIQDNYTGTGTNRKLKDKDMNEQTGYMDGYKLPCFLVSDTKGLPETIDGTGFYITSIGTDEFPFIGNLVGVSGVNTAVGSLASKTSAFHNITVNTSPGYPDHGFFGKIAYLGSEDTATAPPEGGAKIFKGQTSTVDNLLFSNIKIVSKTSFWDKIISFVDANHHFRFSGETPDVPFVGGRENHHIGIVAGHVEYATFSNISVYYSNDSIPAFDIHDTNQAPIANYSSASGILGFLRSLNPASDGTGQIVAGSGVNMDEVLNGGGDGGGGVLSGNQPGYIRAKDVYTTYHHVNGQDMSINDEEVKIKDVTNKDGIRLAQESKAGIIFKRTVGYYFTDNVFTFACSDSGAGSSEDTISNIWDKNANTPQYRLGANKDSDWEIGSIDSKTEYRVDLTPITNPNKLDSSKEYVIADSSLDTNPNIKMLDVGTTASNPAFKSVSNKPTKIKENKTVKYRYVYNRPEDRLNDFNLIKTSIIKNKKSNNYDIKHNNGNYIGLNVDKYIGIIPIIVSKPNPTYTKFIISNDNMGFIFKLDRGMLSRYLYHQNNRLYSELNDGADQTYRFSIYEVDFKNVVITNVMGYTPKGSNIKEVPSDNHVLVPTAPSTNTATKSPTPTYNLMSLDELKWTDHLGKPLWTKDSRMTKMFDMKHAVQWGVALDLLGFNFDFGSGGGIIKAPVGSKNQIANVPTGSLAFYINDVPTGGAKIRTIVSIPRGAVSGELGLDGNTAGKDYYLGLWKGKTSNPSNFFDVTGFDVNEAYEKVEMPRSQPVAFSNNAPTPEGLKEHIVVNYKDPNDVTIKDPNDPNYVEPISKEYRVYLQGSTYMLAYEFSVDAPGLYLLACSNSAMKLVYCSADGVASSGRDGKGGSRLGTIDFVYDDTSKVVLVTDVAKDSNAPETNGYYYLSNVILSFNNDIKNGNGYININNEKIVIRRWWNSATTLTNGVFSQIDLEVWDAATKDNPYFKATQYGQKSDHIKYTQNSAAY